MKLIAAASCYRAVAQRPSQLFFIHVGTEKDIQYFRGHNDNRFQTTDRCVVSVSLSKTLYLLSIVLLNSNMTEK